MPRNSFVVY